MKKILLDRRNYDLYDYDTKTGMLSKVLRCFHPPDIVTFDRFPYRYYPKHMKEVSKELIKKLKCKCTYYLEDGSRPFKFKSCNDCVYKDECMHHEKYYMKVK